MKFDLLKIYIDKHCFLLGIFRLEIKKKVFLAFALQFVRRFKVFIICGMGFERDFDTINFVFFGSRYKIIKINQGDKDE